MRIQLDDTSLERQEEFLEVFSSTRIANLKSLEIYLRGNKLSLHQFLNFRASYPQLEKFHGDFELANQEEHEAIGSFNVILNNFHNLRKLVLMGSEYYFQPSADLYPNMKKLQLWCAYDNMDVTADLIKAMPNLEVIQVEKLIPRVDFFEALLETNVSNVEINIPFRVLKNVVQLKKLKKKLIKKCKGKRFCKIKIIK